MSILVPRPLVLYVLDPLERAAATFLQQLLWVLVGSGGALVVTQNFAYALDAAGFAAAVSLLTSLLTFMVSAQQPWVDLALRVAKTFLQSVLGTLLADRVHTVTGADWHGALALALPVALTALLKGITALGLPTTLGASLLPSSLAAAAVPLDLDYPGISYLAPDGSVVDDPSRLSAALTDPRHRAVVGSSA